MKNVIRIEHASEYDQLELIEKKDRQSLPSPGDIGDIFNMFVDEIDYEGGDDIILSYCLTNIGHQKKKKYFAPRPSSGITILFFPKYGKIEYEIKKDDFWVNMGRDPIEIHYPFHTKNNILINRLYFFNENLFENLSEYKHISRKFLE